MERVIELHPVDTYEPFEVEVSEPGVLRGILTTMEPPSSIIPSSMGQPPMAELKPVPTLMFEADPSKPKRKRSFIWLQAEVKLTYPGTIEFRGTYVDERTGRPAILYEVTNGKK